ncbi:VC0807 family protein [Nonomuraea sp. NPDC050536]|uniref:VC0807 family protein n=1 Tax=Nonomuraea sp. NPDC050536 TaxID=3364366 RepID=UPI0037C62572
MRKFGVLVDMAVPVALYYAFTGLGGSQRAGLLAAAAGSAALAVVAAVRSRRLVALPVVMALGALLSLAAGLVSGSDRLLLVREALVGIPLGLVFVATAFTGDPVLAAVYRAVLVKNAEQDTLWTNGLAKGAWLRGRLRTMTITWGLVGVAGSLAQVVAAYRLPVSTAVWVTNLIVPAIIVTACVLCGPSVSRIRASLQDCRP